MSSPFNCCLVTAPVQREINASGTSGNGYVCVLCVVSEGVAISCNENADSTVRTDMRTALNKVLPGGDAGGVVGKVLCVPCDDKGRMILGTWQGLYLIGGRGTVEMMCVLFEVSRRDMLIAQAGYRGSHDVTAKIDQWLVGSGFVSVWTKHTSCSVGYDTLKDRNTTAASDVEQVLSELVPDRWSRDGTFEHTMEGDDDMSAHVKTTLVGPSTTAAQGMGGRIYVHEHRDCGGWGGGHNRKLVVSQLLTGDHPNVNVVRVIRLEDMEEDSFVCIDKYIQQALGEDLRSCSVGLLCCATEDGVFLSVNCCNQPQMRLSHLLPSCAALRRVVFGCSQVVPVLDGGLCGGRLSVYACGAKEAVTVMLMGYIHKP
eukprot:GHVS01107151.1.p2 GENE.GHVS01107151.1~~GHVS01107151.1.p2  ORF type:complete len:385 (-),score=68.76 GHVS01107151.1:1526-2638(-)